MSLDTVSGCTNMMVSKAPFSTCQEDDRTHLCSEAPGQSPVKGPSLLHESSVGPRTQCSNWLSRFSTKVKKPWQWLSIKITLWKFVPVTTCLKGFSLHWCIDTFVSFCFILPSHSHVHVQTATNGLQVTIFVHHQHLRFLSFASRHRLHENIHIAVLSAKGFPFALVQCGNTTSHSRQNLSFISLMPKDSTEVLW